ncbi:MAG TPA: hypothetical protein VE954_05790 [Oligoflexus sp.]|uniref:hypothetical protein n=1 Tax=Oligoflexus sp. TaxID=1971216 RepID=UPI002D563C75|nr:hypothetical protein [Oligoflexus sp.]HYX32604.1 hypothetical protein [Oligoflexus sp.]
MLKNKLAGSEYFKIVGLIRTLVKKSLQELTGDGLSWSDVLKFLRSQEFQVQVLEILGGFLSDQEAENLSQSAPLDVASAALQAADQIVQRFKAQRLANSTEASAA